MTVEPGKTLPRVALFGTFLIVASFAVAAWSFYRAHNQSCQRSDATLNVLADILNQSRPSKGEFAAMTHERRLRVIRFYAYTDARIAAARC